MKSLFKIALIGSLLFVFACAMNRPTKDNFEQAIVNQTLELIVQSL